MKMKISVLTFAMCIALGNCHGPIAHLVEDALGAVGGVANELTGVNRGVCNRNVYQDFINAQKVFYNRLYKLVALHSDSHFVFSPYSVWLSLAALAEGAHPAIQARLFKELALPQESCLRAKYYHMALSVEQTGRDVSLLKKRELVLDQRLTVNPSWRNLMQSSGLLGVSFAPLKLNQVAASEQLRQMISARVNIIPSGNSMLLDSLDYQGLWTTAFSSATIRPEPFYDDLGRQIGFVNMMRMRKRARLAHLPFIDAKALELPVGVDGRYKMLIVVGIGHNAIKNMIEVFMGTVLQILTLLQTSLVPIEIAVPRFAMTTELNIRPALAQLGLDALFSHHAATSSVSHPPALPGGLVQRVTITVGPNGVNPPPELNPDNPISGIFQVASNTATGLAAAVGHEFIANKPFMYSLIDAKTGTCLFAGAYSRPSTR